MSTSQLLLKCYKILLRKTIFKGGLIPPHTPSDTIKLNWIAQSCLLIKDKILKPQLNNTFKVINSNLSH